MVSNDSETAFDDETSSKNYNAALVGTMVHKLMEMLVSAETMPSADDAIKNIINSFGANTECGSLLYGVYEKITNGGFPQDNGMPDDILTELSAADEVYCEVPFCHTDQEDTTILWNGIIDLLYKKSGKWHIVDYKTNAEAADLDHKYEGQLSAYKAVFNKITGETADTFIYHIDV